MTAEHQIESQDVAPGDAEKQDTPGAPSTNKTSAFKSLGWLDRFLAVWILLAMVLGVLLGNFVPEVGPALQKGKFAEVSIPIGMLNKNKSCNTKVSGTDCCVSL